MLINTVDLAHLIQLAVAPVFLLAGIAGFLNVMSSRLGRIIDRSRQVDRRLYSLVDKAKQLASEQEQAILIQRINIINQSIGLCTGSALMVCILIICLFAAGMLKTSLSVLIVALFIISMLLLVAALVCFLKEVQLAIRTIKVAKEFPENDSQ